MPVVRDHLKQRYLNNKQDKINPLNVNTLQPLISIDSKVSPVSPIIARKKFIASQTPFPSESVDEVKFGINDSAEEHKFTSYHLDYKYTPPIHKGPCSVCDSFIIGSMVTACEKMYCPGCFLCTNCGIELRPAYYKAHDERPYCRNCHSQLFLPPCHHCGDYLGEHYVKAGDRYFHKPCFTCYKCKQPLDTKRYYEKNGRLYCDDDYNNFFKPKCTKCYKPILDEPINGGGKLYHRNCLSCAECQKPLNPNNFIEKNNKLYCPDCFHSLYSPKCTFCKKPITTGDPLVVDGKSYHKNCFCCNQCHKPLSPNNFKEKSKRVFCPDCYHSLFSPKCTGCRKTISTGDPVNVGGKSYHKNCFSCSECSKNLDPKKFMDRNNKLYCPDCFHRIYSPKCNTCKKPITMDLVNALGKQFHKNCFNCSECQRGLNLNNFMEKNKKTFCPDCYHNLYSPKCYGCKEPIVGEVVKAAGQTWHPDHFCCSNCSRKLSPDDFKQKDGKLFCTDCFHNIFSERCEHCHQSIRDNAVLAMGKYYHTDHFQCGNCNKDLQGIAFYEHNKNSYCEECYLNLFAPKCKGCHRPITNQVYLFALGSDWHDTCFKCTECKCPLDENTFYEFKGQPYCQEHYHARICPDCIKMRRAVEKYLGQPEGSSSKPETTVAYKTLNLPLLSGSGSTGSKTSLNEFEHYLHQLDIEKDSGIPIKKENPVSNKISTETESTVNHHHQRTRSTSGSNFNENTVHTHLRTPPEAKGAKFETQQLIKPRTNENEMTSQWDTLYSIPELQNWKNLSILDTSLRSGDLLPDYFVRDETLTKSTGSYPGDPNLQFESTFKKEISESITRY